MPSGIFHLLYYKNSVLRIRNLFLNDKIRTNRGSKVIMDIMTLTSLYFKKQQKKKNNKSKEEQGRHQVK
jgi:hypothetical protein